MATGSNRFYWVERPVAPAHPAQAAPRAVAMRPAVEKLVRAARKDDAATIRDLLARGAPVDVVERSVRSSLLGHCLAHKRFRAAAALLDAGADPWFPAGCDPRDDTWRRILSESHGALNQAIRARQWDWVSRLIGRLDLSGAAADPWRRDRLPLETTAMHLASRNPPPPVLLAYLDALDRHGLPTPSVAQLLCEAASCSTTSPGLVQAIAARAPGPQALDQALDSILCDLQFLEHAPASPSPVRLPQDRATSEILRLRAATSPAPSRDQVKQWALLAVRAGRAPLLRRTLLPLLPARELGPPAVACLLEGALEGHVRTSQVLQALSRHFGPDRIRAAWEHLDQPAGTAWSRWLSRPGAARDNGTLELAQALLAAGCRPPRRESRSWLEDCFSTGPNVFVRFAYERGVELLEVLRAAAPGEDLLRPNLSGKSPDQILAQGLEGRPDAATKLAPVLAALRTWRLDAALQPAAPTSRSSLRM